MNSQLFQHLFNAYGGDRRNKKPTTNPRICIDDRKEHEQCHEFCCMFASQDPDTQVILHINHLPVDDHVPKPLTKLKATVEPLNDGNRIELVLTAKSSRHLRQLATAVGRVVGRGRRYPKRNWKWIAPRTATSLNRLADVLDEFDLNSATEPYGSGIAY